MGTIVCPDCKGKKRLFALVDGPRYRGPMDIPCTRCGESGEVDQTVERWMTIGGTHRTWRIAQWESLRECAVRLGISPSELSGMEAGRLDPTRLIADIPAELQPKIRDDEDRIAPRERGRPMRPA